MLHVTAGVVHSFTRLRATAFVARLRQRAHRVSRRRTHLAFARFAAKGGTRPRRQRVRSAKVKQYLSYVGHMRPDVLGLETEAYNQGGYFTAGQARVHAVSRQLLEHHVRRGRFERVRRGL